MALHGRPAQSSCGSSWKLSTTGSGPTAEPPPPRRYQRPSCSTRWLSAATSMVATTSPELLRSRTRVVSIAPSCTQSAEPRLHAVRAATSTRRPPVNARRLDARSPSTDRWVYVRPTRGHRLSTPRHDAQRRAPSVSAGRGRTGPPAIPQGISAPGVGTDVYRRAARYLTRAPTEAVRPAFPTFPAIDLMRSMLPLSMARSGCGFDDSAWTRSTYVKR